MPLAIPGPDLSVTLLEPLLRRAEFPTGAVDELTGRLGDRGARRAEEQRQRFDVVTAWAVAALPKLLGWCLPLVARD
ncbi:MAG: RsmG family class I SAM-dependent methyltransferase [Micropruina sp.]